MQEETLTTRQKIDLLTDDIRSRLLSMRRTDGMWEGYLSSSAISTSVSVFALNLIDRDKYSVLIDNGIKWLESTMKPDGSWGDSLESPSNMTATLLSYTALYHTGHVPPRTKEYILNTLGWDTEQKLIDGISAYYGKDLTFSVPILTMCALAGVLSSWKSITPFPFELATLPQSTFRFLNLPVVSYAIPALIAIGILQNRKRRTLMRPFRELFTSKAMRVLTRLQPEDGGFLEAAPLTAFVSMCLAEGGFRDHEVTLSCARFLKETVREDGSWPIDTNLAGWVTSLAAKALGPDLDDRQQLADIICRNATTHVHPYTGAAAGGWGWSNLSGSVPDGDDTSGALVALHVLLDGKYRPEIGAGIEWLMGLQNNDGGMPTFCKGWGKLPFDRSTPDITAHAILAMSLWKDTLPQEIKKRCSHSLERMINWMEREQSGQGNWNPLWFGDQDAPDEHNLVYGAATLADYLMSSGDSRAIKLAERSIRYLKESQNPDGGWGGQAGVESKVTLTARAVGALSFCKSQSEEQISRGIDYLYALYKENRLYRREPIGLYFSRLWYSEDLYNLTFLLTALKRL